MPSLSSRAWRQLSPALALVGLLLVFATSAAAQGPPTQADGHGRWYEHVCQTPAAGYTSCGALVVSDQSGTPLASSSPSASALAPAQFHSAYSLPSSAPSAQTIAIVDAYNDPNAESDLATYSNQYGLPPCTTLNGCFQKVNQTGGTSYPTTDSGWSLEIALDVEIAHAICPNCKILLVEASSASFADLGAAENEAAALGANVISNSWGGSEFSSESFYDSYFNHPGVVVTVSSGDSGYGVEYPAASQYVTAVGGTTLHLNGDGSYQSESAWSGAGSGCSRYESKPSWQHDSSCSKRTVADVSADADPNSGASVYDSVTYNGQSGWYQVGGTSLAAPLIGAVYGLTGTAAQANYGQTPYLNPSALHDVTSGSNGSCSGLYLCTALAGYDGPTGLGTPNGLTAFTVGNVTPPPSDFSLASAPTSQTVTEGAGTSYAVTMSPLNGYSGTVNLSADGFPANTTAGFSATSVTAGSPSSTFSVSTAANTPTGTYTLHVYGTDAANPSLVHQLNVTLVVQAPPTPDFSLAAAPTSQTVTEGDGTSYAVTMSPLNGYSGTVNLSADGFPANATGAFSTTSVTAGSPSSTFSVSTAANTPAGTYTLHVYGTDAANPSLVHQVNVTLVVQAAPAADFSLSLSPSSTTLYAPGSTTLNVTISPVNGFSSSVSLAVSGLPRGVSGSFSVNPATSSSVLTLQSTSRLHKGNYTVTVSGQSGSLSHSASARLTVR